MSESTFVAHEPCPECGSSDNLARYDDGHGHCFGCGHYEPADGEERTSSGVTKKKKKPGLIATGNFQDLTRRKLRKETCQKYGYHVATLNDGRVVQVADYRDDDGTIIAQKVRPADKNKMFTTGDFRSAGLFGKHLWKRGGKRIVITEGEIDCLTVAQVMNLKWPVVSIPNGAQCAKAALKKELEFLESYDQIVLMFDMDDVGRKAAAECAELFTPGKCAVASLPLKDPNDMLVEGRVQELVSAIWEAQVKRPDGIVNGADLWDLISKEQDPGIPFPWPGLTKFTYGQMTGRIYMWCSGSGMGKSELVSQVAYADAMEHDLTVGYIGLEEGLRLSGLRMISQHLGKLVHLPGHGVPQEEIRRAFDATLATGRFHFMDHWGSLDSDNLISKIRYLAKGVGCKVIILDHISIVVSGNDDGDERKALDVLMTNLRSLVEETGVTLHAVSHLKRPQGKGHEEGARVSLADLRGSAAIGQLSDMVIGVERNQQDPDPIRRNTSLIRIVKNRLSGDTGLACAVRFDKETGKLYEVPFYEDADGEVVFEEKPSDFAADRDATEGGDDF